MENIKKVKILLIDDKKANLLALEAVLMEGNYELISAQSGEEALRHILKNDFAVILLDVQMPKLNGFETAKLIKQRRNSAHIPIIFITALSKANEHVEQGYSTGAVDYIFKPFNPVILKSKVDVFVQLFLKQKELEAERIRLQEEQITLIHKQNNLEAIIEKKTNQLMKMNNELIISQERFQKFFHFNPNLMAIRSLYNHRFLDVNRTWVEYTGYCLEELKNLPENPIQLSEIDHDQSLSFRLDLEGDITNKKITYVTKQSEIREGLLSTEVIMIHEEPCVISVITDITEQIQLEKEISRLDNLNLVGEMAAGIAHEVRNPMTTVKGFLQIAKNNIEQPLSIEYIDIMLSELERANGIITEFLALAKDKVTHKKSEDINDIIYSLFPLLQADALMNNKEITIDLKQCPKLNIDEKEIRQLILNISLNGLEAMSPGGILVIKTFEEDNKVVLHIQDEGCGISKDILEKIGTPFFTTKTNGTGLGLAICYSIASRHNAKIVIDSSKKGTSFYIEFPIEKSLVKEGHG